MAKKPAHEIEPHRARESQLLRVLDIRNKILQLRNESLIEAESKNDEMN